MEKRMADLREIIPAGMGLPAVRFIRASVFRSWIWFMDPETWAILFKLIYNQQGQFWKFMAIHTDFREVSGGEVPLVEGYTLVDLLRRHGSVNTCGETDITTEWSRDKVLSIRNLDRRAY